MGAKARKARVLELFKTVQIDRAEERYNAYPHELSGGQRQRVMIAMALAMQTKLLIADEPTTALDVTVQKEILRLLKKLQQDFNLSLLFISHDLKVIEEIADEVMVMEKGVAVEYGPVKQVLNKPKHAYTKKLLAAMPGARQLAGVKAKTGRVLVEAKGLSKTYMVRQGGFFSPRKPLQALDGVSFKLIEGETLAVVGESGSGKSTIAKLLVRLIEPTAGQVLFMGKDIEALDKAGLRAARRDIQMVFQDPFSSLNPRMTVGESVGEGIKAHGLMDDKKRRVYVEKLLADCGLPADAYDRYPHAFSGGQRQRICIARALALKPKLIIADEPVSALDVSVQKQILELLQKFKKDYGLSYLFITHDLRVVKDIADRVLVMHKGKLVEQGAVGQIYTQPKQAYTQRLLAAIPGLGQLRKSMK
jgi:peptide/nickel transport system ATP-binding protein